MKQSISHVKWSSSDVKRAAWFQIIAWYEEVVARFPAVAIFVGSVISINGALQTVFVGLVTNVDILAVTPEVKLKIDVSFLVYVSKFRLKPNRV